MSLPKIDHVSFSIFVPSLKKKVRFRPFTVREEKSILMAANSDDTEDKVNAILSAIKSCALDDIDVDSLATYDVEYIFVMLRSHSVGNKIEVSKIIDGKVFKGSIDLNNVKVVVPKRLNDLIEISDSIKIRLKPLSLYTLMHVQEMENEADAIMDMAASAIYEVFDGDKVLKSGEDFDKNDSLEFLQSLPSAVFHKIVQFFEEMPTIEGNAKLVAEDGETKEVNLKGISNFF